MTTGGIHIVALLDHEEDPCGIRRYRPAQCPRPGDRDALRKGIDLSHTYVIVSGRISSEMVRKCLIANIPDHHLPGRNHHPCRGDRGQDRACRARLCPGWKDEHLHPPGTDRGSGTGLRIIPCRAFFPVSTTGRVPRCRDPALPAAAQGARGGITRTGAFNLSLALHETVHSARVAVFEGESMDRTSPRRACRAYGAFRQVCPCIAEHQIGSDLFFRYRHERFDPRDEPARRVRAAVPHEP